jgi:hypothetical protein
LSSFRYITYEQERRGKSKENKEIEGKKCEIRRMKQISNIIQHTASSLLFGDSNVSEWLCMHDYM